MTGWMPDTGFDLEKIADDGEEEIVLAECEWEGGGCWNEVVGLVQTESLAGDPRSPQLQVGIGCVCEEHFEFMLRLDAARPLFWQVTQVALLRARGEVVDTLRLY